MARNKYARNVATAYNGMAVAHYNTDLVERRKQREQKNVRNTVYSIAQADPTNIISVRRGCCRFCHGENYEYQRTDWELDRDLNRFLATTRKGTVFNRMGGGGFVKTRDPNPNCPICLGEGEPYSYVQDFRKLSLRDRQLISGVKIGKNGQVEEIRFHDKIAAIQVFAKIDGMIVEKRVVKLIDATEEELDQYFASTPITINNPALAGFTLEDKVTDAVTVPVMEEPPQESRLERLRRLRTQEGDE